MANPWAWGRKGGEGHDDLRVKSVCNSPVNPGDAGGTSVPVGGGGVVNMRSDGAFRFNPAGNFEDLAEGESREVCFPYVVVVGSGSGDGDGGSEGTALACAVVYGVAAKALAEGLGTEDGEGGKVESVSLSGETAIGASTVGVAAEHYVHDEGAHAPARSGSGASCSTIRARGEGYLRCRVFQHPLPTMGLILGAAALGLWALRRRRRIRSATRQGMARIMRGGREKDKGEYAAIVAEFDDLLEGNFDDDMSFYDNDDDSGGSLFSGLTDDGDEECVITASIELAKMTSEDDNGGLSLEVDDEDSLGTGQMDG